VFQGLLATMFARGVLMGASAGAVYFALERLQIATCESNQDSAPQPGDKLKLVQVVFRQGLIDFFMTRATDRLL
jgi:hypothetical protein